MTQTDVIALLILLYFVGKILDKALQRKSVEKSCEEEP